MSVQNSTQNSGCFSTIMNWGYQKARDVVSCAQHPGTTQKAVRAWIRSGVGITAIANYPYAAGAAATVAVAKPDLTKRVCTLLEGAITGTVKKMSVNQQAALAVAGIGMALYFDPTKIFTVLGTTFAVKLGAEYAIRNWSKENRIEAENQAAKEFPTDIDVK